MAELGGSISGGFAAIKVTSTVDLLLLLLLLLDEVLLMLAMLLLVLLVLLLLLLLLELVWTMLVLVLVLARERLLADKLLRSKCLSKAVRGGRKLPRARERIHCNRAACRKHGIHDRGCKHLGMGKCVWVRMLTWRRLLNLRG